MPATAPIISIITVVRDDAQGLAATRASLSCQIGPEGGTLLQDRHWEWIVVDGGSSDGGLHSLGDPASGVIPRLCLPGPDEGPFDGMDRGKQAALGTFLLFLNAGDRLASPHVLATLLDRLTHEADIDMLYGDAVETAPGGTLHIRPARSPGWAWLGMPAHHCAILYRRRIVEGLCLHQGYRVAGDYAFTVQAMARCAKLRTVPQPFAIFAPGGLSQRFAAVGRAEQTHIRTHLLNFPVSIVTIIDGLLKGAALLRSHFPKTYTTVRLRRYGNL
jgi:putative colanic acid biosynthesis glycosyltransferase